MLRGLVRVGCRAVVALALLPGSAGAAPFLPASDGEVVERLPAAGLGTAARAERQRRLRLRADPTDLALAVAIAADDVARARRDGDPRRLGRAQAALEPWWSEPAPPTEVQVLRATIRQSLHEFDAALADLHAVLARDPRHVQALLTQAVIHQVRGDHAAARASCARLAVLGRRSTVLALTAATCASSAASVAGEAVASAARLTELRRAAGPDVPASVRVWMLAVLADVETRLGDGAAAEAAYRDALALVPDDLVVRVAYADLLLEQGRAVEVAAVLAGAEANDGALLRIALAERARGDAGAAAHVDALRARFAAARLRGDQRHLREEARFTLALVGDPDEALALARASWAVQREPEDARVLLAAARAAGDARAVADVRAWVRERRLEDVRLEQQLAGGRS